MQSTGTKSETAFLGGSFNPVHIGHLYLIHDAYALAGIRNLILVPALISNFKRGSRPLDFDERVHLLSLACEDYSEMFPSDDISIQISEIEKERGGISYTSDTVKYFLPEYGVNGRINFIIGDDLLKNLDKWHDYAYLKEHVRFLCFVRDGKRDYPSDADILFFSNEKVPSSSTGVRSGDISMLSRRVRKYVEDKKLYGT